MSRRASADIEPVERNRTTVRREIAGDHIDESGLASAIGADQADFLAGWDVEGQGIGSHNGAKPLVEAAHRKHRIHSATSFSGGIAVSVFSVHLRDQLASFLVKAFEATFIASRRANSALVHGHP